MDRQPFLDAGGMAIRPLREGDRDELYAIASDPAVWEQHPIHDRWKRDVFDRFFDEGLKSGGALAIVDSEATRLLGSTRYGAWDPEDGGVVEIGWTFLTPQLWGKGANAEIKRAMLLHAFQSVDLVEFRVGDTNYRSRNALEAIGAVRSSRYELERYQGKRIVHLYYEITRDAFASGPLA